MRGSSRDFPPRAASRKSGSCSPAEPGRRKILICEEELENEARTTNRRLGLVEAERVLDEARTRGSADHRDAFVPVGAEDLGVRLQPRRRELVPQALVPVARAD